MRALRQGDRVRILWNGLDFGGRCGTIYGNPAPDGIGVWVDIDDDPQGPRFLVPGEFCDLLNGLDVMLELLP